MNENEYTLSDVLVGEQPVRYLSAGNGERFAVILQGWGTDFELYKSVISALAKKYRVIFPLLPGFGREKEPKEPMSVSDYAELVDRLLRRLNVGSALFFCHSYGGRVMYKLAAMENRFTDITKVIMCDTAGIISKKAASGFKKKLYSLARRLLSTRIMKFFFSGIANELREKRGSSDYKNASPVMRQTLVLAVNEDLSHLIPSIKAPTLIMWGRNDDSVPLSDAYTIEKNISDSAVVVFENSSHFPFLSEWELFRAVMDSFFEID